MKHYLFILYLVSGIFCLNAQVADKITVIHDLSSDPPPTSFSQEVRFHLKWNSSIGVPSFGSPGIGTYSALMTVAGWSDNSGPKHHQINFNEQGLYWRKGLIGSTWEEWRKIITTDANGNVGIGTTTPLFQFDVEGYVSRLKNSERSYNAYTSYRIQGPDYDQGLEIDFFGNNNLNPDINWSYGGGPGSAAIVNVNPRPLTFGTNNQGRMIIDGGGNVGIGTFTPDSKLTVKGHIHAEEVRVDLNVPGPDYVFEKNYNLPSLTEVESYIKTNKHLPEIPSAKEMEEKGINLSEMNMLLLKKVEELTLYLIELKAENKEMALNQLETNKRVQVLADQLQELKERKN